MDGHPRTSGEQAVWTGGNSATELLLVRHGHYDIYGEGVKQLHHGHADPPLSPHGLEQAQAVCSRLGRAGVKALYSSDLRRCRETAAPLARRLPGEVHEMSGLREVYLGSWEGGRYDLNAAEATPDYLAHLASGRFDTIPEAENDEDFRSRVLTALAQIAASHRGERVAVFTHGGVISVVLAAAIGSERSAVVAVDHASVTQISDLGGLLLVRRVNDTHHCGDWLDAEPGGEHG